MVYGIAFCPVKRNKDLKDLGVDDSKALTEAQRESLLQKLHDNDDYIGWAINILSPRYISTRYLALLSCRQINTLIKKF